jgi:hypothetical protein
MKKIFKKITLAITLFAMAATGFACNLQSILEAIWGPITYLP